MVMKVAYLKKVLAKVKAKKQHNDILKKCNLDLTKAKRLITKLKKPTID